MVVEFKFHDKDDKSENIVSVYNLPSIYDESDVHSLFANVGTVVECSIEHDRSKSSSRAIVKFSSEKEAEDASVLSGVSVRYHILKITKGRPPVIAKNGDSKDSKSEGFWNIITQSTESLDGTSTRVPSKVPEEEVSSNDKSSPPQSEKGNESKSTVDIKRDDNGRYDYSSRDRSKRRNRRIRSGSSSCSDSSRDSSGSSSRDRYRNRRDYTPSRNHLRYRSRRGSRYGRSRKEYRRDYSGTPSRSSSYSSRSYYSRGSYRSSSRSYYSDESDRYYSSRRKGDLRRRRRRRSISRKGHRR
ncbi:hypothetical protein MACJ_001107 [Theileria orientalis]|uniref:RRM domain-containing protein n=1 Tax=Theileria orientalis TaxID=68886 RepID=A0A976M7V7_THEOR|nr:hypothetical protein MACJ_001107 [Theileria orientalis]